MEEEKTKAIVLRSVPFRDRQCIVTLFSEDQGILSMIVKGLSKKSPHLQVSTNPLCEAEFVYTKGRSDLLKLQDVSVVDHHFSLRQKYSYLKLGVHFAHVILHSQLPGKASPSLYALLSSFLKQIPFFENSLSTLTVSFYLKLLRHEGLISLQKLCSHCHLEEASHLDLGESFCKRHATSTSLFFSQEEWSLLDKFMHASSFNYLKELQITEEFYYKIQNYFKLRIRQE